MTIFEKFKEYILANPKGRENLRQVADAIGVNYVSLRDAVYKAEKRNALSVVRENAKKYTFKG